MYGSVGAVNIAQLFVAGIIPGILFSGCYIAYVLIRCHFQPEKGPSIPKEERAKVSRRDLAAMMGTSLVPPLFLIFSVIGTIFLGIAAPSEAAAMGSLGAMIVAAAYGKLNWKTLGEAGIEALRITSMVLFIVIAAKMFMAVWLAMGAKMVITSFLTGLPFGPLGILLVILMVVMIMGMFTDWIGLIFVLVPIFAPIATNLGYEPLVFGMLFCCTLQISNMTPPFAYSVFYLKSIAPPDVTVADMYRGALPFVALQVIVVFILITFPYLITFLPGIMSY
jgi:tripartite ATP-independent transporter DctM subunit